MKNLPPQSDFQTPGEADEFSGEEELYAVPAQAQAPARRDAGLAAYLRRSGAGSLAVSLLLHAGFVAAALVWFFAGPVPAPEAVDFLPSGGGGGSGGRETKKNELRRKAAMSQPRARLAGVSRTTSVVLPEASTSIQPMELLSSMTAGARAMGSGGGSGGGKGLGEGPGYGSGKGFGFGHGGSGGSLFGMTSNALGYGLRGVFYDLKQNNERDPTNIDTDGYYKAVAEFIRRDCRPKVLERDFYTPPVQLYATHLAIPLISADDAPKAFRCQDTVQPRRWVIHYQGAAVPPKSGKFRFVAFGDDLIVVLVNGRVTLENSNTFNVTKLGPRDLEEQQRFAARSEREPAGLKFVNHYLYAKSDADNPGYYGGTKKGHSVGEWFQATAGKPVDLDVVIGEEPGGLTNFCLLIEEAGVTYEKDANGCPILPWFRMKDVPIEGGTILPPTAPGGPVWPPPPGPHPGRLRN